MRALKIVGKGGPEVLLLQEVPAPVPGPFEVRVRVGASGLNRADLLQLKGLYPAPPGFPSDIPGLEYAGTVESVGASARRFAVGDRVMGVTGGGGMAELLCVHEREAVRIPSGLSLPLAGAIPEAFWTAFDALVFQGELSAGQTLLVHAAASGVGTAAVQLGQAAGARVLGTSRSKAKLAKLALLGLDQAIVCEGPVFAEAVKAATAGVGADVAMELVAGPYFPETVRSMATRGRILLVGLLGGGETPVDLRQILQRRLRVTGTVLRARPLEEKMALAQAVEARLMPLFERGLVKPVLEESRPASEAQEALRLLEENRTVGKVVLTWDF